MARVGVVFSSGFFGFFAHAGFLSALRQVGIRPVGYSGASSGAILAAMAASGMSDEEIKCALFRVRRSDFWDPDPLPFIVKRLFGLLRGYPGYLNGGGFARLLDDIPAKRIEDCPVPLVVVATNLSLQREECITTGPLTKALHASGAVPALFKPVEIGGALCVDGGMINKAPVQALVDHVRPDKVIVHFIASHNMKDQRNGFLKRRVTPWHIYQLSVNIGRQEAYRRQCDRISGEGIEILEVKTMAPGLGPKSLSRGQAAYETARNQSLEILSEAFSRKGGDGWEG